MADESLNIDIKIQAAAGANSVAELKKSIKDLQDAAVAAGNAGDDALASKYVNAAGQARDKIGDLNDAINATKGSADKLGAISNIGQSIAGGFAAAQGAAALFGASQEDVQQQLLKVQAATALLSGIQSTANIKEQLEIVKIIALQEVQTVNTRLQTVAEEGGIVAKTAAAAAQKALNLAVSNFPGLIIVAAIGALIAALANLGDSAEESAKKQVAANEKILASTKDRYAQEIEIQKALGRDTIAQEIENQEKLQAQYQKNIDQVRENDDLEYEDKRTALDKLYELQSESLDKVDILRAQALKKEYDDEKKSAEDSSKTQEDKTKKIQEELEKRAAFHQQYLDALKQHDADVQALALEHIAALESYETERLAQAQADADALLAIEEDSLNKGFNAFVEDRNARLQVDQKNTEARLQIADYSAKSLASIGNILIKDADKLAAFQKEIALIQIGIDTARAISSVVAAASSTSITPVDLAIKIAAGVATVLANIAQAKKLLQSPKATPTTLGGAGAKVDSPNVDLSGSRTPSPRISGTGNIRPTGGTNQSNSPVLPTPQDCNCGPKIGTGSTNLDENGVVKAFVVESDITDSQGRIQRIKRNSTFG